MTAKLLINLTKTNKHRKIIAKKTQIISNDIIIIDLIFHKRQISYFSNQYINMF
jgi:hypothetical protein